MIGREPCDRSRVTFFGDEFLTPAADRSVWVVVNFATRNVRHLGIEQSGKGAQDAAFRLSAKTEKNEIMAREDGVDDLWNYGVIVSDDAGEDGAAFAQAGH